MGNENNHDSKNGLISILLLIMLTTGALIDPLTSSRPFDPLNKKLSLIDEQKIDARLWQDPIAVTEQFLSNKKEAKKNDDCDHCSITDFTQKIKQELGDKTVSLKVVAVSVFGSSYSEPVEYRLRYRYAVVSALGSSGYAPQDNEHIKYFDLNTEAEPKPSLIYYDVNTKITLPYEWYENNSQSEKALVIWINEDKIPEGKYRDFIDLLYQELKDIASELSFSLIGPTNTSLLVELMKRKPIEEKLHSFRIFSAGATISDGVLLEKIKNNIDQTCSDKTEDKKIQCMLDNRLIVRTIGQDENLTKALLWELEQRDVNRKIPIIKEDCKDQLVLISEQDSLYARSLVNHFSSLLEERCIVKKGSSDKKALDDKQRLIKNFTYLRGLDGKLPEFDESNKKSHSEKNTKEQKNLLTQLDDASPEHAEGRNQFDYLRRLIEKIEQLDSANGDKDQIKAIGIIGTDVYDKLLILHALKESFKHKIFFTTDLDARFLHKDQSTWTRNLVVASNYDFSLRPELQGTVMPFRDSYQTSTYLATLVALNRRVVGNWVDLFGINNSNSVLSNKLNILLTPQIFEIGRTQAIHLASPSNTYLDGWIKNSPPEFIKSNKINDGNCSVYNFMECETIEPDRTKQIGLAEIICMTLILLVLVAYISWGFLRVDRKKVKSVDIVVTVLLIFILLFLLLPLLLPLLLFPIYQDNFPTPAHGEPFLLLEGVSVWPNLVIRYLGIILMCLLIIFFYRQRTNEIETIEGDFGLSGTIYPRCGLEAVMKGPFLQFAEEKNTSIDKLWLEYKKIIQHNESKGYLWIILASLVSLALTLYAFWGLGYLNFPARGVITFYAHYILVAVQFLILWGLIFWIAYEAIACKQLIERIVIDQTEWSPEVRKKQKAMTGLPEKKLNPYLHFVLITKLVKSINTIIYLPFILMLIIAIGRSNIFDNLGFSPALIVVYLLASVYLITILFLLRKSAEKQCVMVLQYYEDYRMRLAAISSRELGKADNLLTEIRNAKQSTFVPFLQRPALLALLLPGGGIGLTSIVEYLYN